MRKIFALILSTFLLLALTACVGDTSGTSSEKSGEDYELLVWRAFWEGASQSFGVEYSDYKVAHTVYDYISDFTTSDGYTAHYYLIKTAFETKNIFGQDVLHPVTARCYYVPDYSNTVYVTFITLDGETVHFAEEKENWLMGMSGGKPPANTETNAGTPNETTVTSKPAQSNPLPTQNNAGAITTEPNAPNSSTTIPSQPQTEASTIPTQPQTEVTTTIHTCTFGSWEYFDENQHYRYCSSCFESEYVGHAWDNGTIINPATCSTSGEKEYTCSICGYKNIEIIETTAHSFTEMVESNRYLKAKATYTSGAEYYYSCTCGEIGSDTFVLNNRIEWITTDMLQRDFNLSSGWIGESELRLWTYRTGIGERGDSYLIYDQMRNGMGDSVYNGSYNGVTVRFYRADYYNGNQFVFNYDDLVAAGIICGDAP